MNRSLLVFQSRETGFITYDVPATDKISDEPGTILFPPGPPTMIDVDFGLVIFQTVANATSYKIERRLEGGQWEVIGTVPDEDPDNDSEEMIFSSEDIIAVGFYRVIATNEVGDSLPSAPLKLDLPVEDSSSGGPSGGDAGSGDDSEIPVCPDGPSEAAFLQRYQIADYFDGLFSNEPGALATSSPLWDGIFYKTFHGANTLWVSGEGGNFGSGGGEWSNGGEVMCHVRLYLDVCSEGGVPTWTVEYLGGDTGGLWIGSKVGGNTPVGTYIMQGSEYSAYGPSTLVIEESTGTTTEAGNIGCDT